MKLKLLLCSVLMTQLTLANDSTGYVNAGGVQYIQNNDIAMEKEDLFISQEQVVVNYQFRNLTNRDITENIVFPMPKVTHELDWDFADTEGLLNSFQVKVNGKTIIPKRHIRAYFDLGNGRYKEATTILQSCGLTEQDLLNPWLRDGDRGERIDEKIENCQNPELKNIQGKTWASEVIYSWQQTFKANAVTEVYHRYIPLIGSAIGLTLQEDRKDFCMDQSFLNALQKARGEYTAHSKLGYVLTTGAKWAKPIHDFKLTIERAPNERISLCWDGEIKKVSPTQFVIEEKNFIPKQDLNILFIRP